MMVETLPTTLAGLVELVQADFEQGRTMTPSRIRDLVRQAQVTREDMEVYADYDHPKEDGYGRKMVYDGGSFELMVMTWNPGDFSSIHNHGYTQWGAVQSFGNAQHYIYRVRNNRLEFAKKEILTEGAIVKVNNALIHQMGNPTSESYLTLHIYGCSDRPQDVTADARNFDLEFSRISHTTGGAFFNLPSDQIYDIQSGPEPTLDVFANYARLLMDYYNRLPQDAHILSLKRNLLRKMEQLMLIPYGLN